MNIQYYYADNDLLRSWKISSANTHCGLKFHLRCWWSLLLFPWLAHIWLLGVQCWMRELCWHLCQEPSPPARLALLKHASGAPNRAWHFGYPWAVRWWKAWALGTVWPQRCGLSLCDWQGESYRSQTSTEGHRARNVAHTGRLEMPRGQPWH